MYKQHRKVMLALAFPLMVSIAPTQAHFKTMAIQQQTNPMLTIVSAKK